MVRSQHRGSPRVRGRISVALILEPPAAGMCVAEIVDAYPSLSEESVRGVLAVPEPHPCLEETAVVVAG